MSDNASFQILSISDILPNRFQPRIKFDDETIDELAESISRFGVIEPIVVRPIGNKYEIIAGERRYKASKLASKTTIPSIVISLSDKDSEELALLENVQRQSLNPIEEAVSYKRILDMGYITREELSKKIGKPQSVILNKTRLLSLADEVQSYLLNNKISERHARALLSIDNLDDQVEMLHRIVNERLTVKKTNKEIKKYIENNKNDDAELLFDSERGNDKMDIDKIMREAQDINSSTDVSSAAPDLMAAPANNSQDNNPSQVFESTPVSNETAVSQEPNKFVSVQPMTESQPEAGVQMVNQVPGGNGSTFDNMFSPIDVKNSMNSTNVNQAPVTNTVPVSSNLNPNMDSSPSVSTSDGSINEEISGIVSEALKNQPVINQVTSENVPLASAPLNNIPDFSINPSANSETGNVQLASEPLNNEIGIVNQGTGGQNTVLESSTDVSSDVNVPILNGQVSVPNLPVGETLVNSSEVVSPVQTVVSPVLEPTQNIVSNNVPDFAKIVEKLRACADEIEKSGHFVNLEEVDLENQYKVIFTFDK